MGGGGGGTYPTSGLERLQEEARRELQEQALTANVNAVLAEKLAEVNSRDVEKIGGYLDEIADALRDRVEDVTELLFGGSVAKHTYVDGLSDVDALVLLKDSGDQPPSAIRDEFARALRASLPVGEVAEIRTGRMAVSVRYRDGTEIQLLPATRQSGDNVAIPSEDGGEWRAIMPRRFARALTRVNQAQGQLVVPTIKLAKAILATEAPGSGLSGSHIEALALAAFREYSGPRNLKSTVEHWFRSASQGVLRPVSDITGQSRHIDEYLGKAGSQPRRRAAAALKRLSSRLEGLTTVGQWQALLDDS